MRDAAVRCGVLLAVLALSTACGSDVWLPTTSTAVSTASFPAVTRPARVYVVVDPPSHNTASRFVLYDDGTFALQYSAGGSLPFREHSGTYEEADGGITFRFAVVAWAFGTGSINRDSLVVRYNLEMQIDGFEEGVYMRTA